MWRGDYMLRVWFGDTVLRGESGRGKTTLFDMIREYNRYGKESGVSISCDRELLAIEGDRWEENIQSNPGIIIVIDEDSK
jgi:ABC-type glutathione transport system ATPase component